MPFAALGHSATRPILGPRPLTALAVLALIVATGPIVVAADQGIDDPHGPSVE
jgi:hypothetical protein